MTMRSSSGFGAYKSIEIIYGNAFCFKKSRSIEYTKFIEKALNSKILRGQCGNQWFAVTYWPFFGCFIVWSRRVYRFAMCQ